MERTTGGHALPSSLPGSTADPRHRHVHVGAVVDSHAAVVDALVPYVEEGLRAGDLVVLGTPPDTASGILDALGESAVALDTDLRLCLAGVRPPDVFVLMRGYLERAGRTTSGRLRIAAHVQRSDDPLDWREGERYEAAANVVLAASPVTALCVYDRSAHAPSVIASVERTHPLMLAGASTVPNGAYLDPRTFVRRLPLPREPVESGRPVFAVDDAATLAELRHALGAALAAHVPDEEQRGDLHLAVSEVAANAFRHGARPVSARMWADSTRIVCAITDRGHRFDDPIAGYVPAHGPDLARGGMGLWLARKLWDTVDLVAGEHGFTVRLSTALRAQPPGSPTPA